MRKRQQLTNVLDVSKNFEVGSLQSLLNLRNRRLRSPLVADKQVLVAYVTTTSRSTCRILQKITFRISYLESYESVLESSN